MVAMAYENNSHREGIRLKTTQIKSELLYIYHLHLIAI